MSIPAKPLIVLAAGGTGGHVFPAEALASELLNRSCRLALITDRRGGNFSGVLGGLETYRIRAGGVAGKGIVTLLQSGLELICGLFQARRLLKRLMPSAVVGFGGYASVPTMFAAGSLGLPTAIHEQNAILGRANRFLAPRVRRIATCFDITDGVPASATEKVTITGMPVRPAIVAARHFTYGERSIDGDEALFRLLVIGGSQGARVLSDIVPQAMGALGAGLRRRLRVVQQCRPEDIERVRAVYAQYNIDAELRTFFNDVSTYLGAASLIVARAGASTVAELTAVGRPAILVPYSYAIDDHQSSNAHAINEAGAGWVLPESSLTAGALKSRVESLVEMPAILQRTAANARNLGRPEAAKALADMVLDLVSSDERKVA